MSKFIIFAMLSVTLCKASDLLDVLSKNTTAITTAEAKSAVDALWASSFSKRAEGTAIQKLTSGFRELIKKTTDEAKKASASCAYLMWFTGRTHGFSTEKSEDVDLQSQLGTMQLIARNVARSMVDTNGFSEEVAAQYVLENMFTIPFSSEAQHAKQTTHQDQTICAEVFKNLLNDMGIPTSNITSNTFEGKLSLRNIWEQKVKINDVNQRLAEIIQSPERTRLRAARDSLTDTVKRLTEELEKLKNARKQAQANPARNSSEDQAMSPCTPEEYYELLKELENYKKAKKALEELNEQTGAPQTPQRDAGVQTITEGVPATDKSSSTHPTGLLVNRLLDFGGEPGNDDGSAVKPATPKKGQGGSDGSGNSTGQTKQTPPTTPRNNDSTSGVEKIASQTPTVQGRISDDSVMNPNFNTPVREALAQAFGWFSPSSLARFFGYPFNNLLTIPAGDALVS